MPLEGLRTTLVSTGITIGDLASTLTTDADGLELARSGDVATTLTRMSGEVMQLTPSEFEQAWDNGHTSNWK